MADGFKQRGDMLIVGFDSTLQFRQFSCQFLVRPEHFPQLHEGAHDVKSIARGVLRTLATIMAPCSVKAWGRPGENLSVRRWSQFATTSAFSFAVSLNMKSAGKRVWLRFTCSFRRLVLTAYHPSPGWSGPPGNRIFSLTPAIAGLGNPVATPKRVVVSFGVGSLSKHRSFPRRRESSSSMAHFQWLAE